MIKKSLLFLKKVTVTAMSLVLVAGMAYAGGIRVSASVLDEDREVAKEGGALVKLGDGKEVFSTMPQLNASGIGFAVMTDADSFRSSLQVTSDEWARVEIVNTIPQAEMTKSDEIVSAAGINKYCTFNAGVVIYDGSNSAYLRQTTKLNAPAQIIMQVPHEIDSNEVAIVCVNGSEVKIYNDTDDNAKTITINADILGSYSLVYAERGTLGTKLANVGNSSSELNTGNASSESNTGSNDLDDVPKTGETIPMAIPVSLAIVIFSAVSIYCIKKTDRIV